MKSTTFYRQNNQIVATLFYDDERDAEVESGCIDAFVRSDFQVCSRVLAINSLPKEHVSLKKALAQDPELVKIALDYLELAKVPWVEFILDNDTLCIVLRNRREAQELLKSDQGNDDRFLALIEYQLCNGWQVMRNSVDGWAGFSDALFITPTLSETEEYRVYHYPDAWKYDPTARLLEQGCIYFASSVARPLAATSQEELELEQKEYENLL